MDQSLVHTFSWRHSYGPMVLKVFLKFPLHWYWSMDGSSQPWLRHPEGQRQSRRRTNVQQLTCNIDLSNSFYYLFFSFVLIELKPFVLKGKVLGKNSEKV